MALSCYENLEELEAHLNSAISIFPPELLEFDSNFAFSESCNIDPFWDSHHHLLYSNNCHSLLPNFVSSPPENLYSQQLGPEIFPSNEYGDDEFYPYLKRQKVVEEIMIPSPEILNPFPDFGSNNYPQVYSHVEVAPKKPGSSGGSLMSAQSIAARQRRSKISKKTQELGKLIPGAQKMNSASEMFQAAFKYIILLQAQVGILETMENGDSFDNQEIGRVLASSLIQEKLYTADKCLVPKKLIKSLPNLRNKLQMEIDQYSGIRNVI